jgi:hypothetical protein
MERKFYTDDFEQLLKEKSDEFRMYPSKRVWHSIYNDLHPGRKWPSIAASMLLILALLLIGYWNNNTRKSSVDNTTLIAQKNTANSSTSSTALNNNISQPTASNNNITAIQEEVALPATNSISVLQQKSNTSISSTSSILSTTKLKNQIRIKSATIQQPDFNNAELNIYNEADAIPNNIIASAVVSATVFNTTTNSKSEVVTNLTANTTSTIEDEIASPNIIAVQPEGTGQINTAIISTATDNNATTNTDKDPKSSAKNNASIDKKAISTEEKSWIEDYAFHNKSKRKKWQDRTAIEFYVTPNVGYRTISNDSKYNLPPAASSLVSAAGGGDAASSANHTPGLGLEAGVVINYAIAKNIRVKAGIQANYTSYGVNANETNHPILTNLMLTDLNLGFPYMQSRSSTLSNSVGSEPVMVHNKTYQLSMPLGLALKLSGNNKLEWYAGATIQPTFIFGGKAYLISADRKNYVTAPDLIRKWNLNAGFETYINYKFDRFTLQAGPQFRYQLLSTYYNKYTVKENLYNAGLKIGILKNF